MPDERAVQDGSAAIAAAFERRRARGGTTLIPFLAAGDPDLETTVALARAAADAGADLIELGVPFSDPLADGPVIQAAYERALRGGTSTRAVFECAAALVAHAHVPVVLMTSLNTILARGAAAFCDASATAGVAGLIVPDLPFEEVDAIGAYARPRGIATILLVAPDTPPERALRIARASTGFVYLVRGRGTTGSGYDDADAAAHAARLRGQGAPPVAVGFGIATPDDARAAARGADGVIVGSALVESARDGYRLGGRKGAAAAVGSAVAALRAALDDRPPVGAGSDSLLAGKTER